MQEMTRTKQRSFVILLFLLLLLGLFLMQLFEFGPSNMEESGWSRLPVSIRASSQADYSRDSDAFIVQPVSVNIFDQIIHDLQGAGDPQDRISTLEVSLSMPVPTMTLNPLQPNSTPSPFLSTPTAMGSTTATPPLTASIVATTTTTSTLTGAATSISSATPTSVVPAATSVPRATKKVRPTSRPRPTKRP